MSDQWEVSQQHVVLYKCGQASTCHHQVWLCYNLLTMTKVLLVTMHRGSPSFLIAHQLVVPPVQASSMRASTT